MKKILINIKKYGRILVAFNMEESFMWTSRDLKNKAWHALSNGSYGMCLIAVLICNMISMVFTRFITISPNMASMYEPETIEQFISAVSNKPLLFFGMFSSVLVVSLAIGFFINNPLNIGLTRFFTQSARGNTNLKELAFVFSKGFSVYLNIVRVQFFKTLFLFLWAMVGIVPVCILMVVFGTLAISKTAVVATLVLSYILLILALIPMLIKSYQYMMIDYILTDEPEISWREAFSKSKKLSHGQVYRMFKLNISFIGWTLLGILFCGVGTVLVIPYINMTFSMLYLELTYYKNAEGDIIQ